MNLKNKRILITQPLLHEFSGSIVVTLELAEFFKNSSAEVEVYSHTVIPPVLSEFEKREISVHISNDNLALDLFNYDYIWIHSQVLPDRMVKQLSAASDHWEDAPYFIFLHMSPHDYVPCEFQWIYKFEDTIADKILFVSEEVAQNHSLLIEEEIPVGFFRNPAPVDFLTKNHANRLNKVLIVSNHAPEEIIRAAALLKNAGITVDHLGINGKRYELIQPSDIQDYDAIITIGKTVQYCILSQKPVYVYDSFGGPGYLRRSNYELSKKRNFSGRGFNQKSSEEIVEELQTGWIDANKEIIEISESEADLYRIDKVVESIFADLQKRKKNIISEAQALSVFYAQRLQRDCFLLSAQINNERANFNSIIESNKKTIEKDKKIIEQHKKTINQIRSSKSYRLGNFLARPLRKTKQYYFQLEKRVLQKGISRRILHPQKICLVLCVYNEEESIPYCLKHIEPYIDFIVALDDGSTDKSKDVLKTSKKLKYLIEKPEKNEVGEWNETANREELLKKAKELGADWILAVDPDERFEKSFLKNLRSIVESSDKSTVYGLHLRELWDNYDQFRTDGIWGRKINYCLFPLNGDIIYSIRRTKLHHPWYPDYLHGHERIIDYNKYHLKMITPEGRKKRANLYKALDPNNECQSIGYDYLVDENGLEIQKIAPEFEYDYSSLPPVLLKNRHDKP